eukprot:10300797-Ditylum_brightwellii.AAC.1
MSERIDCNKNYTTMNGKCIDRFATPQQMAQLMLVAENKITGDKDNKPRQNNDDQTSKFTPSSTRIKS